MRIALVSDVVYPYHKGGKERRLDEVSKRLADAGHDVHIYTMQWWAGPKVKKADGITLHAISKKYPLYIGERRSVKEGVLFAIACFKMFGETFDAAEVDHMPYFPLYSMWFVCLLKRKPMLATWHEVWGRKYWKTYIGNPVLGNFAYLVERCSIFLPQQFVAVSQFTANRLQEEYNVPDAKIIVSTNGTNLDMVKNSPKSDHISDVIFVGRLLSHKNVDMIVRAIAAVAKEKPEVHCVIVGKGPESNNLKKLAEKEGVAKNIQFMEPVEETSELFGLMKASKVFVFPSEREGFGLIALEANACGLPVFTLDTPGNATATLIQPGKNGKLFKDENGLVELLKENFVATGTEEYAASYSWKNTVKPLLERYES